MPTALFNAGIFSNSTLSADAIAAYADANPNVAGNQMLGVNQAIIFGWNNGTYLSVNDNLAPFNANSDLLVNVTFSTIALIIFYSLLIYCSQLLT